MFENMEIFVIQIIIFMGRFLDRYAFISLINIAHQLQKVENQLCDNGLSLNFNTH